MARSGGYLTPVQAGRLWVISPTIHQAASEIPGHDDESAEDF